MTSDPRSPIQIKSTGTPDPVGRRVAYRVSVFGGATAIIGYPISVSLSQGGLFLALTAWLVLALLRLGDRATDSGRTVSGATLPLVNHPALWFAALIYGVQLLSLLLNAIESGDFAAFFARGYRAELKDVFLLGLAFWTAGFVTANPENRRRVERWFWVALVILVVTGFISIFSIYRLQKLPYHLLHGWEPGPGARYQHFAGTLFAGTAARIHLYMPIGLMNTHLTYGGLLMLCFPFLTFRALETLLGPVRQTGQAIAWRQWLWPVLLAVASTIFVLNNGRSAIFGMLVATGFGLYVLSRLAWKRRVLRLAPLIVVAVLSLVVLDRVSTGVHSRIDTIVAALFGRAKHTDFQRTLVWQGALFLAAENPLFGVGPGNFEPSIHKHVAEYGQEQPHLWVAYELAQRGHAHNDMLHFLTIAGPFSLLCYLLFFAFYLRHILRAGDPPENFWKWGPLALLAAGLFQCYFQDDEVVLPFWALVGYSLAAASAQSPARDRPTIQGTKAS